MKADQERIAELEDALRSSVARETELIRIARLSLDRWKRANENATMAQQIAAEALVVAWEATRQPK